MLKFFLTNTRLVIVTILIAAFLMSWVSTASAFNKINTTFWGVAIKGYDTVAYHTEGRAVKGNSEFSYTWNDAKWYFVNKENMELFIQDPERYSPQYGGH
jgi:YHS domain-containing protein